ncbi:hypothetical protein CC86DRAFT_464147 [Ophiobolus disseminans]|uniref:Fungal N-terminal domain-containing protein n=1 Tax=Ophiobolus disseminans TaxID=1469910 RepID=A0A6A7A9U4_9PLEO|nr:hypothetical protein CC86DRAFT_464147 [Ophiobolus disseminans]
MAETLAVVGSLGAICGLVAGIGKVIALITDLSAKWDGADLTLLSLASQLTALRAATTKIQEWTERGLHEAHHQLIMDLDVSIKCCQLLIGKIESFFSDLAALAEKPLELRQKFKVVFGSAGPEHVQRLIERQTSALTLLLTACNCNTLFEQQLHLEATKTRKVLKRAQADTVSLFVQRDAASFASKMTDNLSKISRIFEFDTSVFSTRVYERAFRGSVKQVLRQRQIAASPTAMSHYKDICVFGDRGTSMNLVINAIQPDPDLNHTNTQDWERYKLHMQRLCVNLMCTIIKRGTPDWDSQHVSVLLAYSDGVQEVRPSLSDAVDACAILWWSSLRRLHDPDPDPQGYLREKIELDHMVFHVDIIPAGGLNIYSGNDLARFFVEQMEVVLPVRTNNLRYARPSSADIFKANAFSSPSDSFKCQLQIGTTSLCLTSKLPTEGPWPAFKHLQSALAIVFVFDLQDYSNGSMRSLYELQARLNLELKELASLENRGPRADLPFLLMLANSEVFEKQLKKMGFVLTSQAVTHDYEAAISAIEASFRSVVKLPLTCLILVADEETRRTDLIDIFKKIANERKSLQVDV